MIYANVLVAGYYLYMESSYTRGGEKADLVSPWTPAKGGGQCLKFYYTMYGKTTGAWLLSWNYQTATTGLFSTKKGTKAKSGRKGLETLMFHSAYPTG